MTQPSLPRRRSCLTVPSGSEKMLAKAAGLAADEIVFDLEDAVAPAEKANARTRVAALLATPAWHDRTVAVRANAPAGPWGEDDVAAIAASVHPTVSIIVPKVESATDVAAVARLTAEGRRPIGVQALIETARGLANVQAIAAAGANLEALILGYADLASSLGRRPGSPDSWTSAQDAIVLAARANDLQPIDGPYFDLKADDALSAAATHARDRGFDGKWAIHPAQIETINAAFTPGEEEIAAARALIADLDRALGAGAGAATHAGGMIDEAMRPGALRTLARAGLTE